MKDQPADFHYLGPPRARRLVIFLHGWATNWRSKGLFTDLAERLAADECGCLLFDLNDYDRDGNAVLANLSQQVARLGKMVKLGRTLQAEASISLLGHSFGCVTTLSYLRQSDFAPERILLLAPAIGQPALRLRTYLKSRPDGRFESDGRISFKRKNGTTTVLAAGYLEELDFDLGQLYQAVLPNYQGRYKLIVAGEDHRRQPAAALAILANLGGQTMEGASHNFNQHRSELGQLVSRYLAT